MRTRDCPAPPRATGRPFSRCCPPREEGEIDLILTKEVSRFARNTVDALACTRRLRRYGVGVVFINDGIDTRQNDGEFRLTIMASVAQEESRKTSERVKWGQRRSMENGVVFGCNDIYGFSLLHGRLTVKEDEAEVIRLRIPQISERGERNLCDRAGAVRVGRRAAPRQREAVVLHDGAASAAE